ncbi:hypothetical protein [Klebsiella pneumoniae]|uniref:hypothetical protein n=1 Tax=Klebsiella pneumoniae TaxID=573 RepID=UPI001E5AE22E|nr:hypothetical protein [Klebsiella pneumoniae]
MKTLEKLVIAKLYFPEEAMDTTIVSVVKCSVTEGESYPEDSAKKDNKRESGAR